MHHNSTIFYHKNIDDKLLLHMAEVFGDLIVTGEKDSPKDYLEALHAILHLEL